MYLQDDPEVECWVGLHLKWVVFVSIPAFVIWGKKIVIVKGKGLGIPLFAFRLLRNNKQKLESLEYKCKYGFLYDGYKKRRFYW
jgi:hypothetical protein